MGERRKFTREFKIEAVRQIVEGEKSLTQVSQELGIRRTLLQGWRQQSLTDPEQAFPGSGQQTPADAEVAQLRHELKRVTAERDILKKAIAIFSQGQK
jgi:transposase